MEKKVLVAIDGSVYSSNSLDYLIKLFGNDQNLSLHLLCIVPAGGSSQDWAHDVDPYRKQSPQTEKKSRKARRCLNDAKERLIRNGFTEQKISDSMEISSAGIATSIHGEASKGQYDAVIIGRRGIGTVGGMLFGSTSSEVIEKCHDIPIWIIDGEVSSKRFLLAVQSSPASLMAADHLAFILQGLSDVEICLYHSNSMFGQQVVAKKEDFYEKWGKQWCDQYLDIENFLFFAHAQVLKDNGIDKSRISQLPAQMHLDISADLLKQAKKHKCGTVVLGRRGRQSAKGLLKGVSDKTLQKADNVAVWLVG